MKTIDSSFITPPFATETERTLAQALNELNAAATAVFYALEGTPQANLRRILSSAIVVPAFRGIKKHCLDSVHDQYEHDKSLGDDE